MPFLSLVELLLLAELGCLEPSSIPGAVSIVSVKFVYTFRKEGGTNNHPRSILSYKLQATKVHF
jgi:hypothetical protein